MNVTKGTLYSEVMGRRSEGEILEHLRDQKKIKVERTKRMENETDKYK